MKKLYFLFTILMMAMIGHSQTLFEEDFEDTEGIFPAGWQLFNVDGNTPNLNVSYVTDSWIIREDFIGGTTDSLAVSTSWYDPAGMSDDWMMTPAITIPNDGTEYALHWEANAPDASFPDGYEVRLSTTDPTIAASTVTLFSIAAENSVFTEREVSLLDYAGETVYISWRNNSTDQFILLVKDIIVKSAVDDIAVTSKEEYTAIPITQIAPIASSATLINNELNDIMNATVSVSILDGTNTEVHQETSMPITLAGGSSIDVDLMGFTPSVIGDYTINLTASFDGTDNNPTDNTTIYGVSITEDFYARDDGNLTTALGVDSDIARLGQQFDIINEINVNAVLVALNAGDNYVGNDFNVSILDMLNGMPNNVIAQTNTETAVAGNSVYTLDMENGQFTLAPGSYVFVAEQLEVSNYQLSATQNNFTPQKGWVQIGERTGLWENIENLGFPVAFVIRPFLSSEVLGVDDTVSQLLDGLIITPNPATTFINLDNPNSVILNSATITDISGRVIDTINLSNSSLHTRIDVSQLAPATYLLTIQGELGQITKKIIIE